MFMTTLTRLVRIWRQHPATKGRLVSAAARFVSWQLASRLHGGKLIVPFIGPTRLAVSRSQTSLTGNIYFGLMEMPEMAFLLHYLREDDVFVDVGANLGSFSILASGVSRARSIAFEPIDTTTREMREQLRLNDISDKVDVREIALGAQEGTVRFFETLETVNRVVAAGEFAEASREVRQSTLDMELDGVDPTLIKMDVEGYEFAVLQGGARVLANPSLNAIILEVHDGTSTYDVDPKALEALLLQNGFRPYTYDPAQRLLADVEFASAHAHGLSDNLLMIRDIDEARRRVTAARPFTVLGRSF